MTRRGEGHRRGEGMEEGNEALGAGDVNWEEECFLVSTRSNTLAFILNAWSTASATTPPLYILGNGNIYFD
ncbi:hypothetical protein VNO78_10264 [Psophocarpus tetragonolobus]|uniref:Uncharacterized protein n=1 Tax=Psophocarpus tetragonolobus TaxID=3891 RepID=A0AAN9SJJ5_PSOTE